MSPVAEELDSWTYIFPGLGEAETSAKLADFHDAHVGYRIE